MVVNRKYTVVSHCVFKICGFEIKKASPNTLKHFCMQAFSSFLAEWIIEMHQKFPSNFVGFFIDNEANF